MSKHNDVHYSQTSLSSVPRIVEEISRTEDEIDAYRHTTRERNAQADAAVTLMYIVIGLGILAFLYWQQASPWVSLGGMIAWLVVAIFGTQFFTSGTASDWIHERYKLKATMYRVDALKGLAFRHFDYMEWQEHSRLPPPVPQTPYMEPRQNYVSPYSPQAIIEAEQWARSLFGSDGYLDPRKVHANGKIKVSVVGSRRAGGSQDAQKYLIDKGFLRMREGGFWVDHHAYPTAMELTRLSAG